MNSCYQVPIVVTKYGSDEDATARVAAPQLSRSSNGGAVFNMARSTGIFEYQCASLKTISDDPFTSLCTRPVLLDRCRSVSSASR